ncbi:MAG: dihydrodipicolinate synthase family protein [Desulfurococcales archaeon]|nr:dihydrodipicolinate synthase family protein [Desulfurococcales archaeon]
MRVRVEGIVVPLITPFKKDLSIDYKALKWLLSKLVEAGINGVFPSSSTGEFPHLSVEEVKKLNDFTVNCVGGRVGVFAGATANSTSQVLEVCASAYDAGADAVVVAPPYYFRPGIEVLWRHYSVVAEKSELPVIIYNNTAITGITIPTEVIAKLAKEYSSIAGIKVTYDDVKYLMKVIDEVKGIRRDFTVLTGSAYLLLPTLAMGGDGAVAALANAYPKTLKKLVESWVRGDLSSTVETYKRVLELSRLYIIHGSIAGTIKRLLNLAGAPVKPYVRPPLTTPEPEVLTDFLKEHPIEL